MSKEYKGWDLLKEIADGNIKEGTKFRDNYNIYILRKDGIGDELTLFNKETYETPDYSYFADNDNTFEIIEEEPEIDIQSYKELLLEPLTEEKYNNSDIYMLGTQINALIKAVKQLDNQINNK